MGRAAIKAPLAMPRNAAVRHADYIGSWLEVLREDNRAVVRAASAASKAAEFLLAFLPAAIDSVVEGNEQAA
jgi:antirestriction protein ArdC